MTDPIPPDPTRPAETTPLPSEITQEWLPTSQTPSAEATQRLEVGLPQDAGSATVRLPASTPPPPPTFETNPNLRPPSVPAPPEPPPGLATERIPLAPVPPPLGMPPEPPHTGTPVPTRRTGLWVALGLSGAVLLTAGILAWSRPELLGLASSTRSKPTDDIPPEPTLPKETTTPELPSRDAEVPPALRSYHDRALKGDVNAMALLGTMYYNGLNTPVNRTEGLKWLRRAAEGGNAAAQKQLEQLEHR